MVNFHQIIDPPTENKKPFSVYSLTMQDGVYTGESQIEQQNLLDTGHRNCSTVCEDPQRE